MLTKDVQRLIERTRSFLSVYDQRGLLRHVKSSWSTPELIELLAHRDAAVAKVAATCLGVLGDPIATSALIASLPHEDAVVGEMSEFALWTIWFGERGPAAEAMLRSVPHLTAGAAFSVLDALIDSYPDWAEPFNQRTMVNLKEHLFVSAVEDCNAALAIQENHFGAWYNLGQAYTTLGLYPHAVQCFRRALDIHPRLSGVRQSLRALKQLTGNMQPS